MRKLYGMFLPEMPCSVLLIKLDGSPPIDPAGASGGRFTAYSIDTGAVEWHRAASDHGNVPDETAEVLPPDKLGARLAGEVDLVIVHLQAGADGSDAIRSSTEGTNVSALTLAHRVLRPGGTLVVAVPNRLHGWASKRATDASPGAALKGRLDGIRHGLSAHRRRAAATGFSIVDSYCVFPSYAKPRYLVSMRMAAARGFFVALGSRSSTRERDVLSRMVRRLYHWSTMERFTTDCFVLWCTK